jgi:hypothetical protein
MSIAVCPSPFAPPLLQGIITTTGQSVPSFRVGTFVLEVVALGRFPFHRSGRFPRSLQIPRSRSRYLMPGTSRIVNRFRPRFSQGDHTRLGYHCHPYNFGYVCGSLLTFVFLIPTCRCLCSNFYHHVHHLGFWPKQLMVV